MRSKFVAARKQISHAVWVAFRNFAGAKTSRRNLNGIQRIEQFRQSVRNPAILCREVGWTVRLYIYAQGNFQHARINGRERELRQVRRSAALVLLLCGARLGAQSAATMPASSGLYDRLESVSAYFPVRGLFLGERSLSRREIQRIVTRLSAAVDSAGVAAGARQAWARMELDAVMDALNDRRGLDRGRFGTAGAAWRSDVFSSRAVSDRIESNGLGELQAVSHPFAAGRHGWPAGQGTIASVAPTFLLATRSALALVIQPFASLTSMREGGWTSERLLHRAYGRGVFHNVALQVGADELRWGQSPTGALFISGNAQPLPAIILGTDTAITLPWLFRLAGPVRMTALLSDLGAAQDPPHTSLAGWQASIQPWARFELGVAVLAQTGGDGGPKGTFFKRVLDLFPVIDALAPQSADFQFSNKFAGGNLRLRLPELSGLDVYYELQIDDFDGRRLRSSFVDDAGHLLGLRLPVMIGEDQLVSRLEWQRTSLRLYEHAQFRSGLAYRDRLIGNPLGPHAAAGYLSLAWRRSPMNSVALLLADERRDPAQYSTTATGPRDRGFRFVRLTDDPDFRRRRVAATVEHGLPVGAVRLTVGHNRAWRTAQAGRGDWAGILSITSQRFPVF